MHENDPATSVFVYGTLKRRQVRERAWPRIPRRIEPAWTLGRLFDLGPYPALIAGGDRVLGELWHFTLEDLPETLHILDAIEGFRNEPGDLYRRVVIECATESGVAARAYTYHYARPLPASARLVPANPSGFAVWP